MDIIQSYKYLKIQDLPSEDRPREKLKEKGASILSNAELLAILLGSGVQNMTSIDLAKQLLKTQEHSLRSLSKCSLKELTKHRGIGYAKAAIITSALELSKRISKEALVEKPSIKSTAMAYRVLKPHFLGKMVEEFWIVLLNRHHKLIKSHQVSKGGLAHSSVDPRVVFKLALESHAHGIILAHNHPSGHLNPSSEDISLTELLLQGGDYLGVKVIDHLIVSDDHYFSFRDHALI